MSEQLTNRFVDALRTLEETTDAAPLTALYSEDAVSGNLIAPDRFQGPDGARQFWTEYRSMFDQAKSEFRSVIVGPEGAALEWTTQGTSLDGKPLHYTGVTLLEMNAEKVTRSCTYFDPGALGRQMAHDSSE